MKKGKKIVIGVAAVAVVAGGVYAVEEAAVRHRFLRFQLQRRKPEMWKKSWTQPERWSVMNRKLFIHR